jgi:N-acyl homoserine lactone hydrolase
MNIQTKRLYYGYIDGPWGFSTLHGYVVIHPGSGAILVDTGIGGTLSDFEAFPMVARAVEDALADHGLEVADIKAVITTHLHQDHFGHNVVFKHLPFYLQAKELDRAREQEGHLTEWFDFAGANFELLEGDAELLPGVEVIATPGHTIGHQSVVVGGEDPVLLVGDAAFTIDIWEDPDGFDQSHPAFAGQVQTGDLDLWRDSVKRLREVAQERVHFCHDSHVAGAPNTGQPPLRTSGDTSGEQTAWKEGGARA